MSDTLSPAAQAIVDRHVRNAFRTQPQGSHDRARAFEAAKALVAFEASFRTTNHIRLDVDSIRDRAVVAFTDAGKRLVIPRNWAGQQADTTYYITGTLRQCRDAARCWAGADDVSTGLMLTQHNPATLAAVDVTRDVLGLSFNAPPEQAVRDIAAFTGALIIYPALVFVADPPVGHKYVSDSVIIPAWDVQHALELGLVDDGTGCFTAP